VKRREFITLLGGAAAAWPLAARAQQGERMRRIGMLLDGDDDDPTIIAAITALRTGLHALKWIEGQNYRFEHRSTGKVLDRMPAAVTDIVRAARCHCCPRNVDCTDSPQGDDDDPDRLREPG